MHLWNHRDRIANGGGCFGGEQKGEQEQEAYQNTEKGIGYP